MANDSTIDYLPGYWQLQYALNYYDIGFAMSILNRCSLCSNGYQRVQLSPVYYLIINTAIKVANYVSLINKPLDSGTIVVASCTC